MINVRKAFLHNLTDAFVSLVPCRISCFASVSQQFFLLLFLLVKHFQLHQPFVHPNCILPVICRRSILGRILDARPVILPHLLAQSPQTYPADCIAHEIGRVHPLFHFIADHVSPVLSRKSHHKSKIALFHSLHVYRKVLLHFQRHILCIVDSRLPVFRGINAEHRKIAAMTRPHPVVRIGAKLADGRRRRANHTYIFVCGFNKQIILVRPVKRFQLQCRKFIGCNPLLVGKTFCDLLQIRRRQIICSVRILIFFQLLLYVRSHIQNPVDECHAQPLTRQFLLTCHGPEPVGQVIMLHRTVLLDVSITTMVIGQHQSFR